MMVDHLLVELVGGLQPDKLARSFSGDQDGLYARVLFAWPAEPSYRPLSNEVGEIEPAIVNALTRLVDIDDGGADAFVPLPVPLTSEAVAVLRRASEARASPEARVGRSRTRLGSQNAGARPSAGHDSGISRLGVPAGRAATGRRVVNRSGVPSSPRLFLAACPRGAAADRALRAARQCASRVALAGRRPPRRVLSAGNMSLCCPGADPRCKEFRR